jgi:hypothetical protein
MTLSLTLVLIGSFLTLDTPKPASSLPDPQAELRAIKDEATRAIGKAIKAVMAAKSETETSKIKEEAISTLAKLHRRAIELAARHARDPIALKALEWVVNYHGPGDQTPEVASALVLLRRDHSRNDGLAGLCENLDRLDSPESEAFLRSVAAENPVPAVQAAALYNLALLLHHRADSLGNDRPREATRYSHEAEPMAASRAQSLSSIVYRGCRPFT